MSDLQHTPLQILVASADKAVIDLLCSPFCSEEYIYVPAAGRESFDVRMTAASDWTHAIPDMLYMEPHVQAVHLLPPLQDLPAGNCGLGLEVDRGWNPNSERDGL